MFDDVSNRRFSFERRFLTIVGTAIAPVSPFPAQNSARGDQNSDKLMGMIQRD
jgi:hypothetical protein